MLEQLAHSDAALSFLKGVGGGLAAGFIAYLKREPIIRALAGIFPSSNTPLTRSWQTTFVQNGMPKHERADFRQLSFTNFCVGIISYKKSNQDNHYQFYGQFSERMFVASYKSQEKGIADSGAWAMILNDEATALVGRYMWRDGQSIGNDFYQWTTTDLELMLKTEPSRIDNIGVFCTTDMPDGSLIGYLEGVVVPNPTRTSVRVKGENVEPLITCTLRYLNHSCKPSARFEGRLLYLTSPVSIEDEVTIDYRQTELRLANPFQCKCMECKEAGRVTRIGE